MKFLAGLTGAAVLFTGVGVAQAQVAVESKVTMSLVFNVSQETGDEDESRIARIRFNTKDLMTFVDAAAAGNPIRSVVHRRTTNDDLTGPPEGTSYLSEELIFLDSARTRITEAGEGFQVVEVGEDVGDFGDTTTLGGASAAQVKQTGTGQTLTDVSRKDVFLDAASWRLDLNGTTTANADDQIELDLIGLVTANSKRRGGSLAEDGLFLTSWSAPVNGGVHVDNAATALDDNLDGFVTGTIKVSGEKVLPQAQ